MVAHSGLNTPQGAEKDYIYRNDIGPVTKGNNKHTDFHSKVLRAIQELIIVVAERSSLPDSSSGVSSRMWVRIPAVTLT